MPRPKKKEVAFATAAEQRRADESARLLGYAHDRYKDGDDAAAERWLRRAVEACPSIIDLVEKQIDVHTNYDPIPVVTWARIYMGPKL